MRNLENAPRLFRSTVARGIKESDTRVDPKGGAYGAGVIYGASVITRGPALGHGYWIDSEMLSQVQQAINTSDAGVKSRFAHPSMSGDGIGKALGRMRNASVDGDITRADLHLFESAHSTPSGDLADYVMNLATEDPQSFGLSIAFIPDIGAEDRHQSEHENDKGIFTSPDKLNTDNLPHARLSELYAVDAVDDPAANPGGLFHRGDSFLFDADAYLRFALGLTSTMPESTSFGVHPERLRSYVARMLERDGFAITKVPTWKQRSIARAVSIDSDE